MTTRALLLLLPGLGDALTASPIIDAITRSQDWQLDVMAMIDFVGEYARSLPGVANVHVADLLHDRARAIPDVLRMRKHAYDRCILPFPATRWQYHAAALAVGARRLITHDYGGLALVLDKLARCDLVALRGGHRAMENVRLAQALGLVPNPQPQYLMPSSWRRPRVRGLLGVHTGTMVYKGNEARRWPLERFAEVIRVHAQRGRRVRVFIGPSERDDISKLSAFCEGAALEVIEEPLAVAAQKLSECEVFLGNDAGLAHLAAALNVKSVVLFGMTDPQRAQPLGPALALRPSDCPSCHDEGSRTFACVRNINYRCIREDMPVATVIEAVERAFTVALPATQPAVEGSFRLYGRPRDATPAQ